MFRVGGREKWQNQEFSTSAAEQSTRTISTGRDLARRGPRGKAPSRCVSTTCVAACPASYNPGFVRAVSGLTRWHFFGFPTDRPLDSDEAIHARLREWVASAKPYICAKTWRSFDDVRLVDGGGEAKKKRS